MAKHYDKNLENVSQFREDHPKLTVYAVCRNHGISKPIFQSEKPKLNIMMLKLDTGSRNYADE